jgi:Platelet-activating factor acetylhydrolase, isoform II
MLIFLIFACVILTIIFISPYLLISANPFPEPSGKWSVGTTDLIWDKPDLSGIVAKIWYPTEIKNNIPAPYIDRIDSILSALTAGKNPLYKFIFKLYLARIKTPVTREAILGDIPDGFPVILLSPGFGFLNVISTFYALEFASHGAIVVGINHPGSSGVALLSDGSAVGIDEKTNEMTKRLFSNNSKLLKENPTEFARLVYLTFCGATVLQADNISCVLDKVIYLNSNPDSRLYRKVNEAKIFAAGYSIGGSSSFVACGQDGRITKGVNLDGYIFDPSLASDSTNYKNKELLFIHSDREKYPKDKNRKRWMDIISAGDEIRIEQLSTKANLQRIAFPLTEHLDFSDLPFLITIPALVRSIGLLGDGDGRKLLKETATIAIEFFNNEN